MEGRNDMNDASRRAAQLALAGISEVDAPHLSLDLSVEQWLHVPGHRGYYSVSTWGFPRSEDRRIQRRDGRWMTIKGQPLTTRSHASNGMYPMISLSIDGTTRHHYIHRLVLETFVGPCPSNMQVRHLDGDPSNARLDNLVYGTPSENGYDRTRHGTAYGLDKTHCPFRHELVEPNLVDSLLPRRICKACARSRGALYANPRLAEFGSHQARSNLAYAEIMAGVVKQRPLGSDTCRFGHPLIPINLVRSARTPSCLACCRTYGVVQRALARGEEPDFQAISDAKFAAIVDICPAA